MSEPGQVAQEPEGLYVHIPFCVHKCPYCDFASGPVSQVQRTAYLRALELEIRHSRWKGASIRTLFLGGGTPSELRLSELEEVLSVIRDCFDLSAVDEVTMECNPGTLRPRQLERVRQLGVNRISLGVQSFTEKHLDTLERVHGAAEAIDAYRMMRAAGFDNVSVDLMFGLPAQTFDEWKLDLAEALDLAPEHLSLYQLTIESNTPFGSALAAGEMSEFDADLGADMYEWTVQQTGQAGLKQYEISNFARPGRECRHNLLYWENDPFLGLGLSAASFLDGKRWCNTRDLQLYCGSPGRPPLEYDERLPLQHRLAEELMLRLRLNKGVGMGELEARYQLDPRAIYRHQIVFLESAGLIEVDEGRMRLTSRGRLLASSVSAEFLQSCQPVS